MNDDIRNSLVDLPIGTVIKTKGFPGLLMIAKKLDGEKSNYRCIAYPDGYILKELFRDIIIDEIENVLFIGYIRM